MKTIIIEWRHLDQSGDTCDRCSDTGSALRQMIAAMQQACPQNGYLVQFVEVKLPPSQVHQSNSIFVNGVPVEHRLQGARASKSSCGSCSDLIGKPTACRTIEFRGAKHEVIPAELVYAAACMEVGCDCGLRFGKN